MIRSYKGKSAACIMSGKVSKDLPPNLQKRILQKLIMLDSSQNIIDLRIPPSNHLEALQGDRSGQWSIRINDQWRICFRFLNGDAFDVKIVDYH